MIWVAMIIMIVCIVIILFATKKGLENFIWIPIALLIISTIIFRGELESKHPSAIDVYRGKTTLEITYRDSVAVDSVVVYKMK